MKQPNKTPPKPEVLRLTQSIDHRTLSMLVSKLMTRHESEPESVVESEKKEQD